MIGSKAICASGTGKIDDGNTTGVILEAGETFTGVPVDVTNFTVLYVTVYSDVASATDGLKVEMSPDGVTWRDGSCDCYTVPGGTQKAYSFQASSKWARLRYVNGDTDQAEFDLQLMLKRNGALASSHRIQDSIVDDDDAELVKAVITGKTSAGIFVNFSATKNGNLKVANVEDGLSIARGIVTGTTFIHKFGNAPDFDKTDNEVHITDLSNDATINQMVYQYSATANIDSLSSSNAGDTQNIEVSGLDVNYDLVTQTITLTGQTRVALTTNLIRVFRMKNVGTTNLAGTLYCYVNTAIVAGVPTDSTKVRASIKNGNNQTLMAIYTVPLGKTGYLRDWYASSSGASKDSNYVVRLKARPFGQVFQLKHIAAVNDSASSYIRHLYSEPEVFAAKTDIEMTVQIPEGTATGASFSGGFDIVLIDD